MDRTNTLKVLGRLRREKIEIMLRPDHHAHFDMSDWAYFVDNSGEKKEEIFLLPKEKPTLCSTAACIAGTAVLTLEPLEKILRPIQIRSDGTFWTFDEGINWSQWGARLLGLTDMEAEALFVTGHWPLAVSPDVTDMTEIDGAIWLLAEMLAGRLTVENVSQEEVLSSCTDYGMWLTEDQRYGWRHNGTWLPVDRFDVKTLETYYAGDLETDDEDGDDGD